ncbi:MAG: type II secretion system protein [Burkholderiales bacterium]
MTRKLPRPAAGGFTLIELIAVLIVLAILSAVGMSEFVDWRRDARIAALEGYRSAIHSAAVMGQAAFIAAGGDPLLPDQSVTINGQIVFFHYGFPRGTLDGMPRLVTVSYLVNGIVGTCGVGCVVWPIADAASGLCNTHYQHPGGPGSSYYLGVNPDTC